MSTTETRTIKAALGEYIVWKKKIDHFDITGDVTLTYDFDDDGDLTVRSWKVENFKINVVPEVGDECTFDTVKRVLANYPGLTHENHEAEAMIALREDAEEALHDQVFKEYLASHGH